MTRLARLACLWLACFAAATASAQTRTEIIVHVERSIQQSLLTIRFENGGPPTPLGNPFSQDGAYRNYRYWVEWPVGGRSRRSDFSLYAKIVGGRSNTFYLRLRPNVTPVEIFVFNRQYPECQWMNLAAPAELDEIFEQLAIAEAMLSITSPEGRCSPDYLERWTRVWLDRINLLRARNQFVRLNPRVISAIRDAHAAARQTPLDWVLGRPMPLPGDFARVVAIDQALSAKFD